MSVLAEHRVLDADLAGRVHRAVGFRDILVHDDIDVDDAVVVARCGDLSDLADFVAALAHLTR